MRTTFGFFTRRFDSPQNRTHSTLHLARLLDKARASLAGKAGDYHYNCPLDQRFFAFTGIDHEAMLAQIKSGKTDIQILEWVNTTSKRPINEVIAWSSWLEQLGPGGAEGHEWIASVLKGHKSARDDVRSFSDPAGPAFRFHSSVYLSARPRAFSTGYFFALAAIFASMAAATSRPVALANSSA